MTVGTLSAPTWSDADRWTEHKMTSRRPSDTDRQAIEQLPVRTDWAESETPVVAVTEALATATGRDIADIGPIQRYVDVDALNTLVQSVDDSQVYVSFTYEDLSVAVTGSGSVTVGPALEVPGDELPEN